MASESDFIPKPSNLIIKPLDQMKKKQIRFVPARAHAHVTTGKVIRILRKKKEWTQEELARRCRITATNLSMLENDRLDIGKKRALQIAHAFGVHPAIIMFPEFEAEDIRKVA